MTACLGGIGSAPARAGITGGTSAREQHHRVVDRVRADRCEEPARALEAQRGDDAEPEHRDERDRRVNDLALADRERQI
jgi:hypothetical protein